MNCILTGDLIDAEDVGDWNFSKNLTGGASASVNLSSPNGKYDPLNLNLKGSFVSITTTVNDTPFNLFTGRVRSVSESFEISGEETVEIQIASVPSMFFRKPVTAETLNGPGQSLLQYILTDYAGLDPCWIDSLDDNGTNFTYVNFSENSVIAGIRKLCEACRIELFTTSDGKIKTEPKKDFNDPVDYVLPTEYITGISRSSTEMEVPSVCRVRGRYVADTEYGTATFVNQDIYTGVPVSTANLFLRVRSTKAISNEMALQSDVNIISGATSAEVLGAIENDIVIKFTGTFTLNTSADIEFSVTGPNYRVEEFASADVQAIGMGLNESIYNKTAGGKIFPFTTYDRESPDTQMLLHHDELTSSRIEVVAGDNNLIEQHGVAYMSVDNPYIQSSVEAQLVGERALFEKSVARSRISVECVFNPFLTELNQIVSIPTFYRSTTYQKALLTGMSFSYRQDPRSLTVSYEFSGEPRSYQYEP